MTAKKDPIDLAQTFTHRLHALHKLTDRVSQAAYLEDADMPIAEGRCLAAVGSFTPLSVNELARAANLDKGQASRAAQSLVDQGYVHKAASATDGRGVVLTLTAKGRRTWQRVMSVIERRNEEILCCLNAGEREQLQYLLDRLVAHARAAALENSAGWSEAGPAVASPARQKKVAVVTIPNQG